MNRAPNWTPNEFEYLLQNPTISDEGFRLKLPNRTSDAIKVVRQGVHAFHSGKNYSMLSKMMVNRLQEQTGNMICPICKEPLK